MYEPKPDDGKRPALRVIPRQPRPWRVAWREAWLRVMAEKGRAA